MDNPGKIMNEIHDKNKDLISRINLQLARCKDGEDETKFKKICVFKITNDLAY